MYRLADDMVVRLPRIPGAARQVDKEQRWLPQLAPQLPLQVPVPLGRGVPGQGFLMPWSVYAWLDDENAFDRPSSSCATPPSSWAASSLPCGASRQPAARSRLVAGR
jgi:aminoglycoside phosphotransferase (APT) family kinase protein